MNMRSHNRCAATLLTQHDAGNQAMARYDGRVDAQERRAVVRIVNLRRYRDMSQQALADAAGMPRFALQAVEVGQRNLRLGEAIALCTALGVELGAVVSGQPLVLRTEVVFE